MVMPTATAGLNAPPEIPPKRKSHRHDGEADGEAVIGIARRVFGSRHVQHHVRQGEAPINSAASAGTSSISIGYGVGSPLRNSATHAAATAPITCETCNPAHPQSGSVRAATPPASPWD